MVSAVSPVSGPHLCQHQPPPWTVTAPEVPKCVWVPRRLGAPWDHIQTLLKQRRIENYWNRLKLHVKVTSSSKILRSKEGTAKQPSAVTQYSFLILLSTASSFTYLLHLPTTPPKNKKKKNCDFPSISPQFPPVCPTSAGLRVKRTGSGTTAGTWPAEAKATASTSHGQVCATGGNEL